MRERATQVISLPGKEWYLYRICNILSSKTLSQGKPVPPLGMVRKYIIIFYSTRSSMRHFGRVVKATACYPSRTMCDSRCVRTRRFESCRCRYIVFFLLPFWNLLLYQSIISWTREELSYGCNSKRPLLNFSFHPSFLNVTNAFGSLNYSRS